MSRTAILRVLLVVSLLLGVSSAQIAVSRDRTNSGKKSAKPSKTGTAVIEQTADGPALRYPVIHFHTFSRCYGYLVISANMVRYEGVGNGADNFQVQRTEVGTAKVSHNFLYVTLGRQRMIFMHTTEAQIRGRNPFTTRANMRNADELLDALRASQFLGVPQQEQPPVETARTKPENDNDLSLDALRTNDQTPVQPGTNPANDPQGDLAPPPEETTPSTPPVTPPATLPSQPAVQPAVQPPPATITPMQATVQPPPATITPMQTAVQPPPATITPMQTTVQPPASATPTQAYVPASPQVAPISSTVTPMSSGLVTSDKKPDTAEAKAERAAAAAAILSAQIPAPKQIPVVAPEAPAATTVQQNTAPTVTPAIEAPKTTLEEAKPAPPQEAPKTIEPPAVTPNVVPSAPAPTVPATTVPASDGKTAFDPMFPISAASDPEIKFLFPGSRSFPKPTDADYWADPIKRTQAVQKQIQDWDDWATKHSVAVLRQLRPTRNADEAPWVERYLRETSPSLLQRYQAEPEFKKRVNQSIRLGTENVAAVYYQKISDAHRDTLRWLDREITSLENRRILDASIPLEQEVTTNSAAAGAVDTACQQAEQQLKAKLDAVNLDEMYSREYHLALNAAMHN